MTRTNPFLTDYTTPYGAVPFTVLQPDDFLPAVREGIGRQQAEIDAIVTASEPPTFANTVVALERSGRLLDHVTSVFFNLLETDSTDQMMALSEEIQPLLTEHANNISLNAALFERIRRVHHDGEEGHLPADEESRRLLQETYEGFTRSGALLTGAARERYRELTGELDLLTLQYGQNALRATQAWSLLLTDEADLAGLPDALRQQMADAARRKGKEGWLLTLDAPTYRPFMKHSERRDLREQAYRAYGSRAAGGDYDNTATATRIAALRLEKARLLGYETYADYRLAAGTMAKTVGAVNGLLEQLLDTYIEPARRDVAQAEAYAKCHMQPWDFAYYSERLREEQYAVGDELLRPYFPLPRVRTGVFGLATRLYGLTFERRDDIPKYHPEVETYVVHDRDGSYLGLLYADFFPRPTKQAGAWMTEFQPLPSGATPSAPLARPHVSIVMNFTRPTAECPSLLTYDEVQTFLHEFGHALHGLLTRCRYRSMSGTNVAHDFVELPSQFNENFLAQKEFLDTFAAHYQTGEKIPDDLVARLRRARTFQAAYACVRQLSFGMLDMAWHTLREQPGVCDDAAAAVAAFEREATERTRLLPHVEGTLTSTAFTHIFSGGYAAGYYGYKWAEVLDADAFAVFEREGLFNPDTAARFRRLLEAGDSRDPAELYREFRGGEPTIDALMQRDGLGD